MVVDAGEYVHVVERRRFDSDLRRHFFGQVQHVEGSAMRVTGYTFVYDSGATRYVRSAEQRTRIIALDSSGLIINIAPPDTLIDEVRYEDRSGRLTVTDGADPSASISTSSAATARRDSRARCGWRLNRRNSRRRRSSSRVLGWRSHLRRW